MKQQYVLHQVQYLRRVRSSLSINILAGLMERMSTPSSQKKTRLVVESYDHSHGIDSIIDSSVVDDDNDSDEDDNESRCLLVLDNAALLFGDTIVVTSLEEFVVVDVALLLVFVAFSLFFFFNLMEGDNGCVPCTGDVG